MIQRIRERNNEQGFTLVELLVVIVILGILASIVVFAVSGITDKGNEKATQADKSTLQTAEEAFYADNDGSVYTTETGLVSEGFLGSLSSKNDICVSDADYLAKGANKAYVVVPENVGTGNFAIPAGSLPAGTDADFWTCASPS